MLINCNQNNIRDKIINLIKQIVPIDNIEKSQCLESINWIKSDEPIFRISKPDNPNKHLVSYFVVFDEKTKKILLVDHKKAGLWLPPGGHVEIDENPTYTVKRECLEELGILADFWINHPIFITQTVTVGITAGHIDVSLWYVIKGSEEQEYQYDQEEFAGIKWFGLDEIPYEKSDPHMERFIRKMRGMFVC
ncbi:MAG: 8-oxo-dGTP diphosphatase [Candidatus Midichloriaceae bacterium]|jgi:8-oxo-dGTP diphosphatase